MGLLINNELIWVSIPKCASTSIEQSLLNSNLEIKKHSRHTTWPDLHLHIPLDKLYEDFGIKETICITRNPLERFISSLETIWLNIVEQQWSPIIAFEDIDNDFLYKTIDNTFLNYLHSGGIETELCNYILIKDYKPATGFYAATKRAICSIMIAQNGWKLNEKCTYEFDITELDKFEHFFHTKYNEKLIMPHIIPTEYFYDKKKSKSKIIVNDELIEWYNKMFEARFIKNTNLI